MRFNTHILLVGILLAALAAGCTPGVRFTSKEGNSNNRKAYKETLKNESRKITLVRQTVIKEAERWLGTPYCWGGESHSCTDCSGFTQNVYKTAGVDLPRTARQQYGYVKKITDGEIREGDLIFFKSGKNINHVGIYSGGGMFIHASSSAGVTKTHLTDGYFRNRIAGFGSVLD